MSTIIQRVIEPSVLYFGTPVALVSSVNPDGSSNLSPISSVWALADRLARGLGLEGQAIANLMRDGDCVVNLPNAELWPQAERLARHRITHLGSRHIDTTRWQPRLDMFRHYCGTSAPQGANFRAETQLGKA
jgi:flavin reductase (DIM6/NTAB) family NADH-FMN oxidoreductase RutF